jgi:hypothetical protein
MKITLLRHYQNMRGQTLTAHKEYDVTDPALGGLASYLVENGYAYISEKDAPKPAPVIEPLAVDLDETGELEDPEETGEENVRYLASLKALEDAKANGTFVTINADGDVVPFEKASDTGETEDLVIGVDLAEGEDFTTETVVNVDEDTEDEPAPRNRRKK